MENTKSLKKIALLGIIGVMPFISLSAGENFPELPEGLPDGDIVSNGDNHYTSPTFGSFKIDTSIDDRVIHDLLGPLVWSYDHDTKVVTLTTEWYGDLYTAIEPDNALGLEFPYLISEVTGATYKVLLAEKLFWNHKLKADGNPIGRQSAIGVDLSRADTYYKGGEIVVGQMQEQVALLRTYRNELSVMQVAIGSDNIEQKRQQIIDTFSTVNDLYGQFFWYKNRINRSWFFVENQGGSEEDINKAKNWAKLYGTNLEPLALAVFEEGQEVLNEGATTVFTTKLNERAELVAAETARKAAEEAAAKKAAAEAAARQAAAAAAQKDNTPAPAPAPQPTTPSNPTTPVVTEGDAIDWNNVNIIGLVAGRNDVKGWSVTAKLSDMGFHNSSIYGWSGLHCNLSISGTNNWQTYYPYPGQNAITGNIWIFIPRGDGTWDATVFEGYGNYATVYAMGNLNFHHTNILQGTAYSYPWQPKSGMQFGWMVSSNVIYPGSNGTNRSNIIIQNWP